MSTTPPSLSARIEIKNEISVLDQERLRLEQVKLDLESSKAELEREKFKTENRWKLYAAAATVGSALFTAATTAYLSRADSTQDKPPNSIGLVEFFGKSNDFLSSGTKHRFESALENAQKEVWFVGTSFYISTDTYYDILLRKLQGGIDLNFMVLDPATAGLGRTAEIFGTSIDEVRNQAYSGLHTLSKLGSAAAEFKAPGRLSVKLISEPISSRFYFFDPKMDTGLTYFVPQVHSQNSQVLPGFLVSNKSAKFHETYFAGVRKAWAGSSVVSFEEWRTMYPSLLSKSSTNPGGKP